jgi:ABC-type transport system substrate-binding protein
MKGTSCAFLVVVLISILAALPYVKVSAQGQFSQFESKGPKIDGIDIAIYSSVEAEMLALQKGDIDMIDGPLPADKIEEIKNDPKLSIMSFPDYGFYCFGINLRRPPLNDVKFRQALMFLVDRERIVNEGLKGLGNVLPAGLVGPAYGDWQNTNVPEYSFNPEKAAKILDDAGYVVDQATGKRIDPATGLPIRNIVILARIDDPNRKMAADLLSAEAQKLGIPIVSDPRERRYWAGKVNAEYDFDIATAGFGLEDVPDWLYRFFHSSQLPENHNMEPYWQNRWGFNNSVYDAIAFKIKYGSSVDEAKQASLKAQEILAEELPFLPLYQELIAVPMNTGDWDGYVQRNGRIDSTIWWSAFNLHKKGTDFGGTWRLGFGSDIEKLNPFDSQWSLDLIVLSEIYDTLLQPNPQKPLELMPWMATEWTREEWDYEAGKKAPVITFKLAENIKWHDGTRLTSKDVKFTIELLRDKESAMWYPFVQKVVKVETPDEFTVKVFTSETSPWWEFEIGKLLIMPEHVWNTVEDPSTFEAWKEGKLVGSGPFKLTEYRPGEYVRLGLFAEYFTRPTFTKQITMEPGQITQGDVFVLETPPVTIDEIPVEDAIFTVNLKDTSGSLVRTVSGAHKEGGIYSAIIDTTGLDPGTYNLEGIVVYYVEGHENVFVVTKELTVNAQLSTYMIPAAIVIIIAVIVALGVMRWRRTAGK